MTSRRNFVIGAGTLLTGSGTFLGSGAFGVGAGDDPRSWVPVGVRTPSSEGLESSVGLQDQGGEGGDDSGGQQPDDPGYDDGNSDGRDDGDDGEDDADDGEDDADDDDSSDGEDEDRDETDDGDDPDDERENDRDENRDDDGRGGSGAPSGETSIRLAVDDPDVLDSGHVLADDDGALRGLRLEDLNMNALTYVGETADGRFPNPGAGDRVAFLVVNDGDTAVDLSVDVDGTAPGVLGFPAWADAGVRGPRQRDLTSVAAEGLQPGGVVHVVVEVDTTGVGDLPPDAVEAVTFVADPV